MVGSPCPGVIEGTDRDIPGLQGTLGRKGEKHWMLIQEFCLQILFYQLMASS
jgi:hypothetical protein